MQSPGLNSLHHPAVITAGCVPRSPPAAAGPWTKALLLLLDPGPASWQGSLPLAPPSMLSDSLPPSSPSSPGYLLWPARQKPTADSARLLSPPLTPPAALAGPRSPSISRMEPTLFSACRAQHAHLLCVAAFHPLPSSSTLHLYHALGI